MTTRPRVAQLTDDMLDQLYAERDQLAIRVWNAEDASTAWERKADEQQARAEQAEAAIARVRALHTPVQYGKWTICGHCSGYGGGSCDNGAEPHPCATLRALDGTT